MLPLAKLKALHKYFQVHQIVDDNKLFSYAENLTVLPSSPRVVAVGTDDMRALELCQYQYDAVVEIEDCAADAGLLIALQAMCLDAIGDCNRAESLGELAADIVPLDDIHHHFEYSLRVRLQDSLYAVPDEQGLIRWGGERWRIEHREPDFAEQYLLTAEVARA